MKLIKSEIIYKKVVRELEIEVEGGILKISKWIEQDEAFNQYDNDWDFVDKSQEIYDKLDEEKQEEVSDFIMEVKV